MIVRVVVAGVVVAVAAPEEVLVIHSNSCRRRRRSFVLASEMLPCPPPGSICSGMLLAVLRSRCLDGAEVDDDSEDAVHESGEICGVLPGLLLRAVCTSSIHRHIQRSTLNPTTPSSLDTKPKQLHGQAEKLAPRSAMAAGCKGCDQG